MKKIAAHGVDFTTIWYQAKGGIAGETPRNNTINRQDRVLFAIERQVFCQREEREEERVKVQEEKLRVQKLKESLYILLKSLAILRESLLLDRNNFEEALKAIGRIIQINKNSGGWVAQIEPWEEMRARNNKRRGKPPIMVYQIVAKSIDEKVKISIGKYHGKTSYPAVYPEA